jgi:hypothetical protein
VFSSRTTDERWFPDASIPVRSLPRSFRCSAAGRRRAGRRLDLAGERPGPARLLFRSRPPVCGRRAPRYRRRRRHRLDRRRTRGRHCHVRRNRAGEREVGLHPDAGRLVGDAHAARVDRRGEGRVGRRGRRRRRHRPDRRRRGGRSIRSARDTTRRPGPGVRRSAVAPARSCCAARECTDYRELEPTGGSGSLDGRRRPTRCTLRWRSAGRRSPGSVGFRRAGATVGLAGSGYGGPGRKSDDSGRERIHSGREPIHSGPGPTSGRGCRPGSGPSRCSCPEGGGAPHLERYPGRSGRAVSCPRGRCACDPEYRRAG